MSVQRFFAKVKITETCWLWSGAISRSGYGQFYVNGGNMLPHRFIFEQTYGPIPVGLFVCHSCDIKHCVNPEHLFLGNNSDNVLDSARKGRHRMQRHPETSYLCKLTPNSVQQIWKHINDGESDKIIGQRYGVSRDAIRRIRGGKRWKKFAPSASN